MVAKKGFTLVEILIVVVILGILAAIVIPQFTDASTQAKESSLSADLQTVRSQIQLYKIQHGDQDPTDCAVGADDAAKFVSALTTETDKDGNAWVDQATSGTKYGRYMKSIPLNSFAPQAVCGDVTILASPVGDASGWNYDPATGNFSANDTKSRTSDGTAHKDL